MSRIETLMPDANPMQGTAKLPKLNTSDQPWTICRKLGTYLLSALDEKGIRQAAKNTADWILDGASTPADDLDPSSLVPSVARRAKSETLIFEREGRYCIVAMGNAPKSILGTNSWYRRDARNKLTSITGIRLPVAVGAKEIIADDIVEQVREQHGRYYNEPLTSNLLQRMVCGERCEKSLAVRMAVTEGAAARWDIELDIERTKKWQTSQKTATVFRDKKNCDDRHLRAAAESPFARKYRHVEIDDGVDLELFRRLCDEYETLSARHGLPAISGDNAFRFRLTGRHRAIGVYNPALRAIAVDPRHPYSTFHEMLHAWDHEHGMASLSPSFRPILNEYRSRVDMEDFPESKRDYVMTPTEIFARAGELWAVRRGLGGSFAPTEEWLKESAYHAPLLEMEESVMDWFDASGVTASLDVETAA